MLSPIARYCTALGGVVGGAIPAALAPCWIGPQGTRGIGVDPAGGGKQERALGGQPAPGSNGICPGGQPFGGTTDGAYGCRCQAKGSPLQGPLAAYARSLAYRTAITRLLIKVTGSALTRLIWPPLLGRLAAGAARPGLVALIDRRLATALA